MSLSGNLCFPEDGTDDFTDDYQLAFWITIVCLFMAYLIQSIIGEYLYLIGGNLIDFLDRSYHFFCGS